MADSLPDLDPFPDDWQTALCIAAHPDDLEYGTAGAVAAWTRAGKTVTYLLVTSGEAGIDGLDPAECGPVREAEELAGAAEVGVDTVEFLGHPDGVVEYGLSLRRDLARAIRRRRPDVVVASNPDPRPAWGGIDYADHRAVGLAAVDATRDAGNRWVFRDLAAEGLDPWKVRYTALAASPRATHAVDVTDTIEASVASLNAHRRYLEGLGEHAPDVDGMLRGFATMHAPRFGGRLAVAFELLS
ncbi:PIG-L deacetylase family protein [Nakamurella sp.]|uniref:PIG-L deacetylase family protein n=1 Tax=Nakamurella sp. TaxID=1869182 RepID=UPI003B3BAB0C